ncbi:MAG: LptE family protein [Candidatus Omnitrophica bacterium]|nr:LptE family protein [Candidatus Omnitrophota bacterium]
MLFAAGGCGYTTKSLLPADIRSISIEPVKNLVDVSREVDEKSHFRVYRPGLETDLTNAIINRFIFDGNLKVVAPEKADAIVETKITDYRRDALRYSEGDDIQEYRLNVVANVAVYRAADRKLLWREQSLTGDTTFFLSGARAVTEDEAAVNAVDDLARRIVERTIEIW